MAGRKPVIDDLAKLKGLMRLNPREAFMRLMGLAEIRSVVEGLCE